MIIKQQLFELVFIQSVDVCRVSCVTLPLVLRLLTAHVQLDEHGNSMHHLQNIQSSPL